jgi:hypothetical protein
MFFSNGSAAKKIIPKNSFLRLFTTKFESLPQMASSQQKNMSSLSLITFQGLLVGAITLALLLALAC